MPRLFKITVNGAEYQVTVEELAAHTPPTNFSATVPVMPVAYVAPLPHPAHSSASPASSRDELAQMSGIVAHIYVKPGEEVKEGDRLLDLEAMKMKVPLIATHTGKVARIMVAEGDAVESGQALVSVV